MDLISDRSCLKFLSSLLVGAVPPDDLTVFTTSYYVSILQSADGKDAALVCPSHRLRHLVCTFIVIIIIFIVLSSLSPTELRDDSFTDTYTFNACKLEYICDSGPVMVITMLSDKKNNYTKYY